MFTNTDVDLITMVVFAIEIQPDLKRAFNKNTTGFDDPEYWANQAELGAMNREVEHHIAITLMAHIDEIECSASVLYEINAALNGRYSKWVDVRGHLFLGSTFMNTIPNMSTDRLVSWMLTNYPDDYEIVKNVKVIDVVKDIFKSNTRRKL